MGYPSGKDGYVALESTVQPFNEWSADADCGSPEVTNWKLGPFQSVVPGVFSGTFTCKGPLETGGDTVTAGQYREFHLGVQNGLEYTGTGLITKVKVDNSQKDAPVVTINAKTDGEFSLEYNT